MRVSLQWLRELVDLPETAAVVAERLTMAGFEVEAIHEAGTQLSSVVCAEVLGVAPHPKRPEWKLVSVGDGTSRFDVVCGAPNVPAIGGHVALARVGGSVAGHAVEERKLGGVRSQGVLCSETDLEIGVDGSGLLLLDPGARPGADVVDVLGLRDAVLDVNVTPNRPDALGHVGVAREIGAIFGRPVRAPVAPAVPRDESADPGVSVEVRDPAGCPRYGAQVVRGLRTAPSPWAIRYRLHLLGVRAVFNLVDVTNLVLLLYSQPQHAFDLARVRGSKIVVRRARGGETMKTLDGVERTFTADDLLICDGEGPVAVAGVMGGEASGIGAETTDLLIECAHFDPPSIRRTSKRLGLASESSYRFERGTDRTGVPESLAYASAVAASLGGGRIAGRPIDVGGTGPERPAVRLRPERVAKIMGRAYAEAEIRPAFERLGCRVGKAADGSYAVTAPGWRSDLEREIDLIEEIARLNGLASVPVPVPETPAGVRSRGSFERNRRVRELLAARGLMEAVNLPFVDAGTLAGFGVPEAEAVRLANPLQADRPFLRPSLLPGLLGNVRAAFAHREASAAMFEIGRTFRTVPGTGAKDLPEETWRVGAALSGARPEWLAAKAASFDLHDAAAVVAAIAEGAMRRSWALRPAGEELPMFHPRASCRVEIGAAVAGICGEMHPSLCDRFEVPRGTFVLELDLRAERFDEAPARSAAVPRFPSVRRDVAAVFDEATAAGEVEAAIRERAPAILRSARVFDVYRGEPVPAGKKSMAFAITYRAPDRTLTDAEVDEAHGRVVDGLVARYRVTIRK